MLAAREVDGWIGAVEAVAWHGVAWRWQKRQEAVAASDLPAVGGRQGGWGDWWLVAGGRGPLAAGRVPAGRARISGAAGEDGRPGHHNNKLKQSDVRRLRNIKQQSPSSWRVHSSRG